MVPFHLGLYPGGGSVIGIYVFSCLILVQQVVPGPAAESGAIAAQIERLGLTGALILAVGVLWRSLAKKDDQLTIITGRVTEALAFNTDTQKELRGIVEASTRAKQELKDEIKELRGSIGGLTQTVGQCQFPMEDWKARTERRGGPGGGLTGGAGG